MYCPCGKEVEHTSETFYSIATYNNKGDIIYAICVHGFVIINNLKEGDNNG
jgi:hypothetical protein